MNTPQDFPIGTLVKVQLPKKRPYIGAVFDLDTDEAGEVVKAVFVSYLCNMSGNLHPDIGKWRAFTLDKVEVLDQGSKEFKKASMVYADVHKGR